VPAYTLDGPCQDMSAALSVTLQQWPSYGFDVCACRYNTVDLGPPYRRRKFRAIEGEKRKTRNSDPFRRSRIRRKGGCPPAFLRAPERSGALFFAG
jgi:hypothetical protein